MVRFLADENFDNRIIRGLRLRLPTVVIERVQDVGLRQSDDPTILAWAAANDWVLLTHDVRTMTAYAHDRVDAGLPMSGVFGVPRLLPLGQVIDDLVLVAECSDSSEYAGQVQYLPL